MAKKLTKAQAVAAKTKKSAQQQVWRVQNKLDQKRLDVDQKRSLEKSLQAAKKKAGYTGPTKREEKRLSKEKRSISGKRSKLNKEFKDPETTKKKRNELRKELMVISSRSREIKSYLGEKVKKLPKKAKPAQGGGVVVNQEPPWRVKPDHIDPALDAKIIKLFVIDGKKFKRTNEPLIYDAWFDLESQILFDGSMAIVMVVTDYNTKTMSISSLS